MLCLCQNIGHTGQIHAETFIWFVYDLGWKREIGIEQEKKHAKDRDRKGKSLKRKLNLVQAS